MSTALARTHRDSSPAVAVQTPSSRSQADGVLGTLVVAVACAFTLGAAGLILLFDYGRDQAIYALVAREVLAGHMPYRDVFDFKPPGIFYVYVLARALVSTTALGPRVLEVLALLASTLGMVWLARVHFKNAKVGWLAGALSAALQLQLDFWHTAQPETFGGTLTILGLVTATQAMRARNASQSNWSEARWWLSCGVSFGLAGLMKPHLAASALVVATWGAFMRHASRAGDDKRLRSTLVPLLPMLAGVALPLLATVSWFAVRGALPDLYRVLFVFAPEYTRFGWIDQRATALLYHGIDDCLFEFSSTLIMGMVLLIGWRVSRQALPFVLAVAALIVLHIAGVVLQAKFFEYHWGATFPLTALLAAQGWYRTFQAAQQRGLAAVLACLLLFSGVAVLNAPMTNDGPPLLQRAYERYRALLRGELDLPTRARFASESGLDLQANSQVAAYIRAHTPPGAPIYVWGFECNIYDLADRPIASRYIYNLPQRAVWSKRALQTALMHDLSARPPRAIVVAHRDQIVGLIGDDTTDSAGVLDTFTSLRALIAAHYQLATRIGTLDVYLARES